VVGCYIHNKVVEGAGKIATLVSLDSNGDKAILESLAQNIAMHITAANSLYLERSDVPASVLEKEEEIFVEQTKALGKPKEVMANIIKSKMESFFKQNVLLEQPYIKDTAISVQDLIAKTSKELGAAIKIKAFIKYVLGEGIELEKNDFAEEVQKMMQ
ncbi:MAG: translation elongation factor Ts, partial [Rickettsiaceae bacterium]|nr:translation elongation factor Ts [Rickettsiaceae bacterium]